MMEAVLFGIFLDSQKSYDALDWDRCLEILVVYGVVLRTIRLLRTYWDRLNMVARAGGYFGLPFKGYHGVTQGDPLSPTLFNVVVDTVIRHWLTVVAPTEDGMEGLGLSIRYLLVYFYAGDGLVASTQPERLQGVFDVFTGLFRQVGFRTNTSNTVSMALQPCHVPVRMSSEAYKRWTMGIGPTFPERQRRRVEFPKCGLEVAAGSLLTHRQSQNSMGQRGQGG